MLNFSFRHLILALLLWIFGVFPVAAQSPDGRRIIDEVSRRHDAGREFQTLRMVLEEKAGARSERVLRRYMRQGPDGLSRYLLVFDAPSGVRGVALLTWEQQGEDDQWLYLPALNASQLKRIARGGRRNAFMGTDFAFEDLTTEKREAHRYERRPDEKWRGHAVFVVEARPEAHEAATSYEHRRLYVRQDNYMIARIDYFAQGSGRHIKTMEVEKMEPVAGERWQATQTVMETLASGHRTRTETLSRSLAEGDVPGEVFTHAFIESRRHLR